ncbi:M61 family metallopeptidase [Xanthocytophaga agilis]|uniref:PDZ domain-containing protein n=1 Tax=Xanthocytophaga agilis TaxID=3048010 RepID=A0AAE3R1G9_9BACT|nr:PDZ domain-containing protein [Xanthocytophaga agilis]MDJ1499148.1 PDZ domain-containing protein [Xanthocytophaga agilis]
MKKSFILSSLLILLSSTILQAAPKLSYFLSMDEPHTHYFTVKITVSGLKQSTIDFKLPVWTPGSYLVREYARNVEGFTAVSGKSSSLKSEKVSKNAWRVYSNNAEEVTVEYKVYAFEVSVRTPYLDASHGYVQPAAVFMYIDKQQELPSTVTVKPYKDWTQISTGLSAAGKDKWTLAVPNYDILVDSPIEVGNQKIFEFTALGIPHKVAMYGIGNYEEGKLADDMKKIVEEAGKVVGENPNKDYTFIVHNLQNGGGGLEHLNSTTLQTTRWSYENNYVGFLTLVAHEYFHLWNVKRIRPQVLGPFDYDNENYTHMLWVSEGFTSYYEDLIAHRAGFMDASQFITTIANGIGSTENQPGNKVQSAAESSWDAWIKYYRPDENSRNSTISYYTKGGVIAPMLDLEIIHSTNGQKSLDDVMKFLYEEYYKKQKRGFTDTEFQQTVEKIAGHSMDDFFRNNIYDAKTIDYNKFLGYAGLRLGEYKSNPQAAFLGATTSFSSGKLTINGVSKGTPAYEYGLNVNDEIIAIDNFRLGDDLQQWLGRKKAGDKVVFTISRGGILQNINVVLSSNPAISYRIEKISNPSSQQDVVLKKWVKL